MNCPQCHTKVPDAFSFCPQCGTQVRAAQSAGKALDKVNLVLIGLLAVNVVGSVFVIGGISRKNRTEPESSVAEMLPEETTAAPETTAPPETTEEAPDTTEQTAAQTTVKEKTTAPPDASAAETQAATTKTTTKTQQQVIVYEPEEPSTSPADYYARLGSMPFEIGEGEDAFLPAGLYTRADNHDGKALIEDDAKQVMLELPIDWDAADLFCGTEEDDNGTSDSTYRYIADAFPVPGFYDLQLPAAVDLYIHNGTAAHGSHLRAVDYRFGNHADYDGQYIWSEDEIAEFFYDIADYADGIYGGHEEIGDSLIAHYRYADGALDIGYYLRSSGCVLWISRAND